jgi:kumamolisin
MGYAEGAAYTRNPPRGKRQNNGMPVAIPPCLPPRALSLPCGNGRYFASSGDSPGTSWPATSANVVAVGGASISRSMPTLAFEHLASWSEAGSGISSFVLRPSYQASVASIIGNMRAVPDIAADANRETGAWVLDSGNGGWYIVGGISLASPTIAGITNLSSSFAPWTNAELTKIYSKKASNPTAFRLAGKLATAASTPPTRWRRRGISARASSLPSVMTTQ